MPPKGKGKGKKAGSAVEELHHAGSSAMMDTTSSSGEESAALPTAPPAADSAAHGGSLPLAPLATQLTSDQFLVPPSPARASQAGGGAASSSGASSLASSRASSPLPLPVPSPVPHTTDVTTLTREHSNQGDLDDTPMRIKEEAFGGPAGEEDDSSDADDGEGGAALPATASSNPFSASRAPRSAPSPSPSPLGKSPSPSPSAEAMQSMQVETAKEAREVAHATEWSTRLSLEPSETRAALFAAPVPMELDKSAAWHDRTSFHSMMDTYFRPIEYLDLLRIGQLKVLLAPSTAGGGTASAAAASTSTVTTTAPAISSSTSGGTSGSAPSLSSTSSASVAATFSQLQSSSSGASHPPPSRSSTMSASSSSSASASSYGSSTCSCCPPAQSSSSSRSYSNTSSSNNSYSTGSSYQSSSYSSYSTTQSGYSTSGSYGYNATSPSYSSLPSNSSMSNTTGYNTGSSGATSSSGYSSTSSSFAPTNFSSSSMYAPFASSTTLPYPYNYVAPFTGTGGLSSSGIYPPLYNYGGLNLYAPPMSNSSLNTTTGGYGGSTGSNNTTGSSRSNSTSTSSGSSYASSSSYNNYSSSSNSSSYYGNSSSSSSYSQTSGSYSSNSSSSGGYPPPSCPMHGTHGSSSGSGTTSSRSSNNYNMPPRVHASQFVAVLQQLRSTSNSLAHLPSACLPPSYMTPPQYWDPSLVLPPLGRRSPPLFNESAMMPDTPPSATAAISTDPTDLRAIAVVTPVSSSVATSVMVDVSSSSMHLPQYSEFPHLALMLGLNVHPDTLCIPHTQALVQTSSAPSSTSPSSIPGTASWVPPPKQGAPTSQSTTSGSSSHTSSLQMPVTASSVSPKSSLPSSASPQLASSFHTGSSSIVSPPHGPLSLPPSAVPSSSASSSSSSAASTMSLSSHPLLSPTKDLGVPVLITMYASSQSSTDTARSTTSADTKQLDADAAMSAYASTSREAVSVLVDYLASGLSASVAPLASSISGAISQQLNTVQPRLHLINFTEIEHGADAPDALGLGYSVQDRQVDKYRKEFKEREALAAAEKKAAELHTSPKKPSSSSATSVKVDPSSSATVPVVKSEDTKLVDTKTTTATSKAKLESMPSLESASGVKVEGSSARSATTASASEDPEPSLLRELVSHVMLEAHHAAAARARENEAAEQMEDASSAELETRVKSEGAVAEADGHVDLEIDTSRSAALAYSANLPHSLIPASALVDLSPLPALPATLASDSILHELLQLQYYLSLQTRANNAAAATLRGRVMLQHQSLYIEKRIQWMKTIHETYSCATLWQTLRLQLKKGVRDADIPPALLRADHAKYAKEELLAKERQDEQLNNQQQQFQWTIKSDSSPSFASGGGGKAAGSKQQQLHHHVHLDESKLLVRSASAPVESEWTLKTDEQIEAELAAATADSTEEYAVCAICFDGESRDGNPLLYCDRCNVSVHQRCYGIKSVPDVEGWLWVCEWCQAWKDKIKLAKQQEKARLKATQLAAIAAATTLHAHTPTPTATGSGGSGATTPMPPSTGATPTPPPQPQPTTSTMSELPSMTKKTSLPGRPPRVSAQTPPLASGGASEGASGSSSLVVSSSPSPNPHICALCPSSGGAVKQASDVTDADGAPLWVHIVCALWTPKARIMNTRLMSPISVAPALKLQQQAYHRQCSICKSSYGACVPCSYDDCGATFHPLCAWYEGLAMSVEPIEIDCRFLIYCLKHTPRPLLDRLQMFTTNGDLDHEGTIGSASHLSLFDRSVMRARQQRDIRQRGRAHHSEKTREKRRKKQFLDRRRKERARAMREDLYEPGRCAVCFFTETECAHARQYDEVRRREQAATKQHTANQPYFLVNGIAAGASQKNRLLHCEECGIDVHQNCIGVTDGDYDECQKRVQTERHNLHMNSAAASHTAASSVTSLSSDSGWVCRRCQQATSSDKDVSCALCPRKGGAFKKTVTGRWAHVACAVWIPEAGFADPIRLEPIEGLTEMTKVRRRMMCYLCQRNGPCIQCCEEGCPNTFHPTCGLFSGAFMGLLESQPPAPTAAATAAAAASASATASASALTGTNPAASDSAVVPVVPVAPLTHYRVYCKKHTPLHLSKYLPLPLSYTKLHKLKIAYESCRSGLDRLRAYDKKKMSELKEECEYEELVWRESRLEAETGVKSKKLKPPKQPRGRKPTAGQSQNAASGSNSISHSPVQSPAKGDLASPIRSAGRGRSTKAQSSTGGPSHSSGGGSHSSPSHQSQSQQQSHGLHQQSSPQSLGMSAVNSLLSGMPFGQPNVYGTGVSDGANGSNSQSSNSFLNNNLSSLSNSLSFPFGTLPPSSMPLSLPLAMSGTSLLPLAGQQGSNLNSTNTMDLQPLIDLAQQHQQQQQQQQQQARKGGRGRKPPASQLPSKDMNDSQPLQMWLQALESTNTANNLAAAAGGSMNNNSSSSASAAAAAAAAAAAYNASNPFAAFTSVNNSLAQYNLGAAFYQQLAASANLLGGGGSNSLSNNLTTSLANAFTNSITQSLAASLTNSLNGLNGLAFNSMLNSAVGGTGNYLPTLPMSLPLSLPTTGSGSSSNLGSHVSPPSTSGSNFPTTQSQGSNKRSFEDQSTPSDNAHTTKRLKSDTLQSDLNTTPTDGDSRAQAGNTGGGALNSAASPSATPSASSLKRKADSPLEGADSADTQLGGRGKPKPKRDEVCDVTTD